MSTTIMLGKRGLEKSSPEKKKPKETVSVTPELDAAILKAVRVALAEQQQHFDAAILSAVKAAMDSAVIPALSDLKVQVKQTNDAVQNVVADVEHLGKVVNKSQNKVDSLQATVRANNRDVQEHSELIAALNDKITEMEDRSRRNNLRLVGLAESAEGSDPIGFLKANLPLWIPSLKGREIKIERAHRMYANERSDDRPRTFIFKLLDYSDRQAILDGAREVFPISHDEQTLSFFPDYSAATGKKRKAFTDIKRKMIKSGLNAFLTYPAQLKVQFQRKTHVFKSPVEAEKFFFSIKAPATTHRTSASFLAVEGEEVERKSNGQSADADYNGPDMDTSQPAP